MLHRREFLGAIALPAALSITSCAQPLRRDAIERASGLALHPGDPEALAADESFWFQVQQAFTPDRSMVNLNNGGVCPSPAVVQASVGRYLAHANTAPAYVLWRLQQPQKETVRVGLAHAFGCDPEEIAITRNASESLEICQLGLDLERGDEVLTTTQDYPRMLTTWRQRARRDGIVLKEITVPAPCADDALILRAFEDAMTDRTRVVHMCHVVNLTGQIMPVRAVVESARRRGIPVIVDGAHAFAHLDFKQADLACDYYGTSLHKWLFAPFGTGMLFVKRDKIEGLWPLMPAPDTMDKDIRKFEEIGTHALAPVLAISDALTFHATIGPARKLARLLFLRDRWARRLAAHDRVRLHTSLEPNRSSGVALVEIDGVEPTALCDHLWTKHKIFTVAILHAQYRGVRVSPAVYNTVDEIDRFSEAMERVIANGLPA